MLKKIKQLITVAAFALVVATPALVPAMASAQADIQGELEKGTCLNTAGGCSASNADSTINDLVEDVINIFSWVVGIVSVIMIIVGGFRYITSGGNDSNVAGAKNTILYAIIGLVIVALAQFIVQFVLDRVID